jgi:predicted permease
MADFLNDIRHALRMFRKAPAFTLAAVAALALGIGANTAIFSVVNAVVLRPVSLPDPDSLVVLQTRFPGGFASAVGSPVKFRHWRTQTATIVDATAYLSNIVNYSGGSVPEQLRAGQVSASYFSLLRVRSVRGRFFTADEDLPGAAPVVVLSEAFWRRRLNSREDVVGSTMVLGGQSRTVVGVAAAPAGLDELDPIPDLWIPFQLDPSSEDVGHYFAMAGRLAPGVSVEQARAAADASTEQFRQRHPNALLDANVRFTVDYFAKAIVGEVRPMLAALHGAVGLVLFVACANVANLLLVRGTGRRREIAIRAAMGAKRNRIVRQLLTESVLLAGIGGVAGLLIGVYGMRALLVVNTAGLPRLGDDGAIVTADWRVLLFTVALTIATGILFGLFPALQASRADLGGVLKEGGGRAGSSLRQQRARAVLVVVEIALALILVIGSALLMRTAVALGRVDPGFDASRVLTMQMSLGDARFATSRSVEQLVRTGVERLRAVPGIQMASASCCVPLESGYRLPFIVPGRPLHGAEFHGGAAWITVSPGYFEVFDIPVRRGRTLTERDVSGGPPVVVIDEAFAREFLPGTDPLQQRLIVGRGARQSEFDSEGERQIVGVVANVRDYALNSDPEPHMYVAQAQVPDPANALILRIGSLTWVVRTHGAPSALAHSVEETIREATGLAVSSVRPMSEIVSRSTSRWHFAVWLMTVFGASALLLAAIGVYGLTAYSVEQRTHEIGIRLALGAETSRVRGMVLWQGLRLIVVGVAVGTPAALGLARLMSAVLFGVSPWDPAVFAGVPAVLVAVAIAAVWLPARRASRVNPIEALRVE